MESRRLPTHSVLLDAPRLWTTGWAGAGARSTGATGRRADHALLNELLTKNIVIQNELHSACDIEHVLRIYQNRRILEHFRKGRRVGSDHRRPVCHGLEGRESKSFI